jgi:hypothetical protein
MYRTSTRLIAAVTVSLALGGSAFAEGTAAQRNACRPDVFRLCRSYIPNVSRIVACLRDNGPRLSEACHEVMFADHAETDRAPSRFHSRFEQQRALLHGSAFATESHGC